MAYKVFTNGSVLNASEINDNLMNQSVMVFSNSTARAAALTAPVEGMLTWLEDVNRYEFRNGAGAWVALAQGDLLATSVFTAQTSIALDNIFTADYRFYDYYFTATGSTASTLHARLRTGSTDLSTSTYRVQTLISDGTTTTSVTDGTTTQWNLSNTRARMFWKHGTITNPFTAEATGLGYFGTDNISDGQLRLDQGVGNNTTASSYNGIRFLVNAGTITGQVSIYGRKS